MKNLVSVITPVFNGEKYLSKTIESVLNQTYSNIEYIIIDDGSHDSSLKIIQDYLDKDERIKFINLNSKWGGPTKPRNTAIKQSNGEFIAFIDQDDTWEIDYLEEQIKLFKEDYTFVYCSTNFIDSQNKKLYTNKVNRIQNLENALINYEINLGSTIVNTKKCNVFFDEDFTRCGDYHFFLNLIATGHKFYGNNNALVNYRIHSDQVSTSRVDNIEYEHKLALNKIFDKNSKLYNKYKNVLKKNEERLNLVIQIRLNSRNGKLYQLGYNCFKFGKFRKPFYVIGILMFIPILNTLLFKLKLKSLLV